VGPSQPGAVAGPPVIAAVCQSRPVVELSRAAFEELVADALDLLPDDLARLVDNVAVFVEDEHPESPDLLGLYEGQPLTERGEYGGLVMPDRITIFRLAICGMCETPDEVVDEVGVTVVHEVAHHFGIDDRRLHELGWA
jgi:predicted Zn-dependent protease with MMP-like domain